MADINSAVNAASAPASTPAEAASSENTNVDPSIIAAGVAKPGSAKPAPKAAGEKAIQDMRRKYQLKVDGQMEDMEIDLGNEEEVKKHLQLSKAAYKRMQESAEMKKGVQELLDVLRTNPLKVLTDPRLQIPDDVRRKLAESLVNDELAEMAKTPEVREKERLQREYERLKQQVQQEKQARETAEFQRLTEQHAVALDTDISSAIEKSGMPKQTWALVA